MLTVKKLDDAQFEALAAEHPDVFIPLEQSPLWDAVDANLPVPRTVNGIFAYYSGSQLVATARAVSYTARMRNNTLINGGPVWFTECTPALEAELLDTMRAQFKDLAAALYIRMQVTHPQKYAVESLEPYQYDRAIWVDISLDEKALFKSFKNDVRSGVKKARKAGVEVREIVAAEAIAVFEKQCIPILRETTTRNDFLARPDFTYTALLTGLGPSGIARLFVAYVEDRAVSWLISTEYRGHAVYLYAAGNEEGRKNFANFLMQWEVILEMKSRGNTMWDMTAIDSENFPDLKHLTVFKRKFSHNEVTLPMYRDVPVSMAKYKALAKVLNAKRQLRG